LKCKIAVQKLRSIFAYARDYKSIIDEFKKQAPTITTKKA